MTKILLVEDDKSLREIYGVRLLAEGYEIASAGDGEEALAMAVKVHPDLIISDVMMPKISGFDMLDILRSTPETKEIKIIMMTALSSEDQRARGVALGANRYLVKSQVGIEDVVRTVHDVLADSPVATVSAAQAFNAPTLSAVAEPAPARPIQTIPLAPISAPQQQPTLTTTPPVAPVQIPVTMEPQAPIAPITPTIPTPTETPIPVIRSVSAAVTPSVSPTSDSITPQLPQPTAPFSSQSPSPLNNHIIRPVEPDPSVPDIATRIDQELNGTATTTDTSTQPIPPPQF